MHDFTRRTLLQGGTALAATGALTGPALLDFAKAWAQSAPWKAEKGAKLTVMRWKRFVPAEDDAFNAMVAAFKAATGTEMNVFSESFEDVQPKASVAANTGSGLDLAWGLHTLPQLFPAQVLQMNDVADYLGKKYGGWTDAAAITSICGSSSRIEVRVWRTVAESSTTRTRIFLPAPMAQILSKIVLATARTGRSTPTMVSEWPRNR